METQRYPISVRVIGVMHKEKSKMYMTSVLWSDQNDIVIYRTFRDFKKMHRKLKKAFPPASRLKKSDRVIPRFRDKKMKRSAQRERKGPKKSLVCLKFLQRYCNELLSCEPRVTQSADLIQFFQPKDQDLQPEFAKDGIMVMPSDEETRAGQVTATNVTQPFVTETYRCVAAYETKDTKNKPFKVATDEKVDVLIKDKAGWWLVENEDKRMAWFPAPYLERLDDDDADDEDDIDGGERGQMYTAVKSYAATKDDEISVTMGAAVEVLQKSDNGWWLIRYKGKAGYIPSMYLRPYNYPHIRMTAPSLQLPSSGLAHQSNQLSHSQGNLLQIPSRSPSPHLLQPDSKHKSRSLNVLTEQASERPAAASTPTPRPASASPTPAAQFPPPPTITVELDGDQEQRERSQTLDSEGSFLSDSSDFSFSDDFSSSSASSSLNLSPGGSVEEQLRLSRTPPPMPSNRLSPTSGLPEGRMMPSVSDPNLYKGPTTPTVPPRPRAQEILTRCTTITRKNAARALTPTQTQIPTR